MRCNPLPFGQELLAGTGGRTAGQGFSNVPDAFDMKYTGQVRDPETQLDYMNARYYDPAQGRFQAMDPGNAGADGGSPQTWNGFAYVNNSPLNNTDPSGQFLAAAAEVKSPDGKIIVTAETIEPGGWGTGAPAETYVLINWTSGSQS